MKPPSERRVPGSGLEISLSEWAPTGTPAAGSPAATVVILHGFLDQGAAWAEVAAPLAAAGHRVLAPDHRGHGRSEHVGRGGYYHFPDYLRDLDAWTGALLEAPSVLVGHSMGGTIAGMFASTRPERVRALVLVEGLGPGSVRDDLAPGQLREHLEHLRRPRTHSAMPGVEDAAARLRRFNPAMSAPLAALLAARATDPAPGGGVRWRWDPLHRTRSAIPFSLERHLAFLRRVRAPTTLVDGERSPFQIDRRQEREEALPIARRVTLPCGHNPHFELPRELAAVIAEAARAPTPSPD